MRSGCAISLANPFGVLRMLMAGQLINIQRRTADSAGNTRPLPPTPCLSPLRRGSHNGQHSTAAGCRRPRSWPRKGYAYGTESHRRRWWLQSSPRYQYTRHQNRQSHSTYLALYVYGWPAAPRSTSFPRQCRKHPAITLNPVSAGGSDADHKMPGIVRRQTAGRLRCGTGQAVGVGLRAAS